MTIPATSSQGTSWINGRVISILAMVSLYQLLVANSLKLSDMRIHDYIHPQEGSDISNLSGLSSQSRVAHGISGRHDLITVEGVGMKLAAGEDVLTSTESDWRGTSTLL